jgi:uncharacterized protein (DUF1015 family)
LVFGDFLRLELEKMVAIRPFCALRYDLGAVGDLTRVIAPPYDVISPEEQERLYQASPYNIVRLILGKQEAADTQTDNRYTRARRDFAAWCEQGILRADPNPGLYLIEHTFVSDGCSRRRLGFIALLELDGEVLRQVFRHEMTLAAPKADRTKLLQAVPANLEPIFCVFPDDGGAVQGLLEEVTQHASPLAQATIHEEGVRLWGLTDPPWVRDVVRRLSGVSVLIADGHHRFEVALAQRGRYGMVMSYFVSMAEPALVVRPLHRVIQQEGPVDVEALRRLGRLAPVNDLAALAQWLDESQGPGRFGFADGACLYRLEVSPDVVGRWLMAPPVPLAVATLDVSILHELVLPSLGSAAQSAKTEYTAEAAQAIEPARSGRASCAWLLRAIPLAQVFALAAHGLTLPPKSTYFYPKVPSGLALNRWE